MGGDDGEDAGGGIVKRPLIPYAHHNVTLVRFHSTESIAVALRKAADYIDDVLIEAVAIDGIYMEEDNAQGWFVSVIIRNVMTGKTPVLVDVAAAA